MTSTSTGEAIELYCLKPSDDYWYDLLQAIPHDFYHLPNYVALEARRLNATPEGLLVRQGDRYFFLPYLIRSCAPMLPDYISDAAPQDIVSPYGYASALLSEAAQQSEVFLAEAIATAMHFWQQREFCTAYLRLHPLLYTELAALGDLELVGLERREVGRSVAIDLSGEAEEWQSQVNPESLERAEQARAAGFTVRWTDSVVELPSLIALYQNRLRQLAVNTAPGFEPEYLYGLAQALEGYFHLCLVERQGAVVAASFVTEACGIVQCHLSGAQVDMMHDAPSALMMMEIGHWAQMRENDWLHLGNGLKGSASDGFYQFNCQFSPVSLPIYSLRLVLNDRLYSQLIHEHSKLVHLDPQKIGQADTFPAYRAVNPQAAIASDY